MWINQILCCTGWNTPDERRKDGDHDRRATAVDAAGGPTLCYNEEECRAEGKIALGSLGTYLVWKQSLSRSDWYLMTYLLVMQDTELS